jgi:extracellular elastinolytic metalloproteinase
VLGFIGGMGVWRHHGAVASISTREYAGYLVRVAWPSEFGVHALAERGGQMFQLTAGAKRPVVLVVVIAVFLSLAGSSIPASGGSFGGAGPSLFDFQGEQSDDADDFDSRTGVVAPTEWQRARAAGLGAEVRWNRFGAPQSLIKHGGFLASGVEGADAVAAAQGWLDDNAALFRLDSADDLVLVRDAELAGSDGHVVIFQQRYDGLVASPDGMVSVGVVGTAESGWRVAYASSTLTGDSQLQGSTELSLTEGWVEAADAVETDVSVGDVDVVDRRRGWMVLDVDGLQEEQLVRRVGFPTPRRGVIAAYEAIVVDVEGHGHDSGSKVIVDGATGDLLFKQSIVDHAQENPEWDVFPSWPPTTPINRYPWNYPSADTRETWCWTPSPGCRLALEGSSPHPATPWDVEPRTGTPTFTTTGNYAHSQENWFNPFFPGPTGYQPTSPTREYTFPWDNEWFEEECNPDVLVVGEGNDIDAATANLFAMHSRMHNWSYHLGFTEQTWNAQAFNFGMGTAENDPLIGMVQAGAVTGGPPTYAGRDNAFMRTLPDGTSSQSGMFLWQPIPGAFYAPCVDGDYDMAVIGHEYGHMIENRMIGKGSNRTGFHAGAMGESFGDFSSMEHLNEYGLVPSGDAGWAVGPYVTGNAVRAIRNYNMAFPYAGQFPQPGQYPRVNPLNFSDVGYDIVGPQVHADGEIWSGTNFDIRELFIDRYGQGGGTLQRECADGRRPAEQCPGNRRWIQIVFDAFLLMPTAPTFLDARDAYLAADMMRFGGANQDLLWLGFARRGFGENAVTTGTQDTEPIPSFESPLHDEATLVFDAVAKDEDNTPISNANVFVGHYEARVTPAAETAPGQNVLRIVPDARGSSRHRAYDFVAQAEGHGHVRFRISGLRAGETRNVTIGFPTNLASMHNGATATGDGERHNDLIDDTEGTNWQSSGAPVEGRQVLVEFAGQSTFDGAKVSAYLLPGQNRFVALRAFELYACTATPTRSCDPSSSAGWRRIHRSRSDAFPGDNPRPVAPVLNLRTFSVPRTTATHVLFRVIDNQCTGQTSFQGKQDNDPRHETDCRIGTPLPRRDRDVMAAELQILSSSPRVDGAQQAE